KTVNELHVMLKLHEQTLPKKDVAPTLHAIQAGKYKPAPKPKIPPTPKKDNPAKDAICHQCSEVGHWRRNCPVYLAELLKKNKLSQGASTSGICHQCSEVGHWRRNCPVYLAELLKKNKLSQGASTSGICHQCSEVGHWRRNCPVYLAELLKKNKLSQGASTSGIFTIELYSLD
ncbi:zinc finger, CCHC-type containing protein, partial [Tanacetum coccineum]